MKVYDFHLLTNNKFYQKRSSLILWNSEIDINEVKSYYPQHMYLKNVLELRGTPNPRH